MTDPLATTLTDDHRRCDHLLAAVERAAGGGDWGAAARETQSFCSAMGHHFAFEEEELFPALVDRWPMASGPAGVMRMEHAQMRRMLEELTSAVSARSGPDALGILETLHLVIQQHNMKEEGILYPMADRVLAEETSALLARWAGVC